MKKQAPKFTLQIILLIALLYFMGGTAYGQVIYVDADAASGGNTGDDWPNAYTSLQDALTDAESGGGDQIWVAEGIYYPDEGAGQTDNDRTATFQLITGVEIYGGFAGGEGSLNARDVAANPTILSGDIDDNDDADIITDATTGIQGTNSYHLVTGTGTDNTARLDGFTITAGLADETSGNHAYGAGMNNSGGNPVLVNLVFTGNRAHLNGGGMVNDGATTLSNVTFTGNAAGSFGGGMFTYGTPTLTNVTFTGNFAVGGGGMANEGSPTLTHVTITGNRATNFGGGLANNGSGAVSTLTNAIIWGNMAGSSAQEIHIAGGSVNLEYSLYGNQSGDIVDDVSGFTADANSLTFDPQFTDPGNGDVTLQSASPAINAGDNSAIPSGVTTDLAGNDRIIYDTVDMGAYEWEWTSSSTIIFVDEDATGNNTGTSWDDAFNDLQDALATANVVGSPDIDQIWVAEGIYYPDEGAGQTDNDRSATFQLISGVQIYGGFDPDEGIVELDDRFSTSPVILSGDIDGDDTTTDGVITDPANIGGSNAYHVVTGSGADATALLDAVTITGGNANGSAPDNNGGGILNDTGSPRLSRVAISGNRADGNGGGLYNNNSNSELIVLNFTNNQAGGNGGGMFNNSDLSLSFNGFSGNQADGNGGGLFNENSSPILYGAGFSDNSAGDGGGMFMDNSTPTLINNFFLGNNAEGNGGGFYSGDSTPVLVNATFTANVAGTNGGGLFNNNSTYGLANVIIWNNQAGGSTTSTSASIFNNTSTPEISFSLIANSGGSGSGWAGALGSDGGDNIDADPLFTTPVNPGDAIAGANLRQLAVSPVINTGSNQAYEDAGGDLVTDVTFGDDPRLFGGTIDMGVNEFQDEPQTDLNLILKLSEGWRMLSNPIVDETYAGMLDPLWTQGVPGSDYEGDESTFQSVYTWDLTSPETCLENEPCPEWIDPPNGFGNPIPAGSGFLIYVFADDDINDGVTEGFDKTLTLSGPRHTGDVSPTINTNAGGWTLVGNPYFLPVAFNLLERTQVNNAAYVYDANANPAEVPDDGPTNGNGGAWRSTVDGLYGDIVDGVISPGQGFFVQTEEIPNPDPELTFSLSDRITGGQFYGKESEPQDFVRLEMQGESLYNSAWIRFSEEGSVEPTTGEAMELQPLSRQYALLGARKADGTLMDIAHYPLDSQDLEIPLAVEATRSGTFTIRATETDLPAGLALYLYDRQTGQSMPISDNSFEYSFTFNAGEPQAKNPTEKEILATGVVGISKAITNRTDRFLITTTPGRPAGELPNEVTLEQNYPNPFNPSTVISYQLPSASQVRLEVYDMLGRRVATLVDEQVAAGTHQVNFDASRLSSGIYLYRLTSNGSGGSQQIFTKKLTLIK